MLLACMTVMHHTFFSKKRDTIRVYCIPIHLIIIQCQLFSEQNIVCPSNKKIQNYRFVVILVGGWKNAFKINIRINKHVIMLLLAREISFFLLFLLLIAILGSTSIIVKSPAHPPVVANHTKSRATAGSLQALILLCLLVLFVVVGNHTSHSITSTGSSRSRS